MTQRNYTALFPVLASGTLYAEGQALTLDDADPSTQAALSAGTIILTSAPNLTAAENAAVADVAAATNDDSVPAQDINNQPPLTGNAP